MDDTVKKTGDGASAPDADAPESVTLDPVTTAPGVPPPIVARAGQYYRNTRYIMAALTVVMGFWFGYDGFVRWPAEKQKVAQLKEELAIHEDAQLRTELKSHSDHSDTDIFLQRLLAFALPPLGICLLLWALYNSRGEYRLMDEMVFIPGHPAVPLAAIRELDQTVWDRKGIAKIAYELVDGRKGSAKLDDFVYDRLPTDQIYEQIKTHLQPPAEAAGEPVSMTAAETETSSTSTSQPPTQ